MVRAVILLVMLVVLPVQAGPSAQGNRSPEGPRSPQAFKWWQAEATKAELGLTSEQSAKIEEIFQSVRPRLEAAFDDISRYERALSKLISANDTTEMDLIRQLNLVQVAKNEADRQRTLMLFRMQRVLSAEQRAKLNALRERREQERGRGRRGEPPPRQPIKR